MSNEIVATTAVDTSIDTAIDTAIDTSFVQPDQAYQIREKLLALDEMLLEKLPGIATLLRDIHTTLKNDPDTVTLLSEEECSILVRGLKKQTATEIATAAVKKKGGKAMKNLTVDDL